MKLFVLFLSVLLSCFTTASFATELPKLKMSITLVNHSNETLSYAGFNNNNPETIFLVSPKVILPGAKVTITSVTNDLNFADLSGDLHFQDTSGSDHVFHLNDPQQMHYRKAQFIKNDDRSFAKLNGDQKQPLTIGYGITLS